MEKNKRKKRKLWKQVYLYLFTIIMIATTIISLFSGLTFVGMEFYERNQASIEDDLLEATADDDAYTLYYYYVEDEIDKIEYFISESNISFELKDIYEIENKDLGMTNNKEYTFKFYYNSKEIEAIITLDKDYPFNDQYYLTSKLLDFTYSVRYIIWVVALLASILSFVGLTAIVIQTSRKENSTYIDKIPLEIILLVSALVYGALIIFISMNIAFAILGFYVVSTYSLFLLMHLIKRIKQEHWWYATITYYALKKFVSFIKFIFSIPIRSSFIIKTVLLNILFTMAAYLAYLAYTMNYTFIPFFILVFSLFIVTVYIAYMFTIILDASKQLSNGNLDYHVDTKALLLEFKECGENLNNTRNALNHATTQRMKSEHFKTELITNVSHDIKTPLTSIINYSDLLSKESFDNSNAVEYIDVIQRQSDKLKKLLDDLLEASKASTGNIEANLVSMPLDIILSQAIGEYSSKLSDNQLEIICNDIILEKSVLADPRLLWRVFENVLSNICKYSLNNTRVYVDVIERSEDTMIIFKNVSKYPLNISGDELMERFVRGELDRHEEGNGLGLSIARSLIELQDGSLSLVIDGDLFKAVVTLSNQTKD